MKMKKVRQAWLN